MLKKTGTGTDPVRQYLPPE